MSQGLQQTSTLGAPVVAASISDRAARDRLNSIAGSEGFNLLELSCDELMRWQGAARWQALIYDLCPWDDDARQAATRMLGVTLGPILLYLPQKPGVGQALENWARDPRVLMKLQLNDAEESERLRVALERLRLRIPCERVEMLVEAGLTEMSSRASCFVRTSLSVIGDLSQRHFPTATAIGKHMGVSVRTLERTLDAEQLLRPKELLNWLTLLYAMLTADLNRASIGAVARSRGWYPSDLYRLQHRLLDGMVQKLGAEELGSSQGFDLALLAFLRRCGVPKAKAHEVVKSA